MELETENDAEELADELLYKTGRGLVEGNYDLFRPCFALPYLIETVCGRQLLETEAAFRATFDSVRRHHKESGVTDIARIIVSADFLDDVTIGSTHATSLLQADGTVFRKPYPTYSVIRRIEGNWQIVSSIYAILDSAKHNRALSRSTLEMGDPG